MLYVSCLRNFCSERGQKVQTRWICIHIIILIISHNSGKHNSNKIETRVCNFIIPISLAHLKFYTISGLYGNTAEPIKRNMLSRHFYGDNLKFSHWRQTTISTALSDICKLTYSSYACQPMMHRLTTLPVHPWRSATMYVLRCRKGREGLNREGKCREGIKRKGQRRQVWPRLTYTTENYSNFSISQLPAVSINFANIFFRIKFIKNPIV